ncbi:MAG TPA: hypothetical protein VGK10_13675 [Prolixibacteraceae bacterium]|jgi:hypothetical protein
MKNLLTLPWAFLLLLLFNGCNLDEIDLKNKLSKETNLNPELAIPLARANVTVWDLMQAADKDNEEGMTKDSNGLIKIVYHQKDLFKYQGRDLIQFPIKQSFSSGDKVVGDILPADIDISTTITLGKLVDKLKGALDEIIPFNGMNFPFPPKSVSNMDAHFSLNAIPDFTTITLSKGTVEITMVNELKVPVTIDGSLFDVGYNRAITDFTFTNMAANETKTISASLAGKQLSNQLEFRMMSFSTPGSATPVLINLADFLKLSFHLTDLGVSNGHLMISKSQPVKGSEGVFEFVFPQPDLKAFSGVLNKGSVSIESGNNSQMTGTIHFTLSEIKKNGVPVEVSIPLGGTSTTIDLTGAVINFSSDPVFPFNRIPYVYTLVVNSTPGYIDYSSTDVIKMDVSLNDIEFKSFTGDFGKQSVAIDPGKFNMKVDLLNKIEGMFKLANPSLVLSIHNSIGIPASVSLNLKGANKLGQSVDILRNPNAFDLPVPATIDQGIVTGNIIYNKLNSNIVDFISLPPTGEMDYDGLIDFNKINPVTAQNPNFMDMDATLAIDLGLDLPLELEINQLGFKDTTSITGSDFKDVQSADLIINALNGIPLDIDLQLLFVDTIFKKQFGASKMTRVLSAAKVNASGEITSVQSSQTFTLDKTEMEYLHQANGLVLSGSVSSPDSGSTVAPIYSDSEIKLNVAIKIKVNL